MTELAPGVLRGVQLRDLDLRGNPGTPITFAPGPVPLPLSEPAAGRAREIAVEIASAAPFDVSVALSAVGGTLSSRDSAVPAGDVRGAPLTVTPDGDGPVTVRIEGTPTVTSPDAQECPVSRLIGMTWRYCFRGVRVAAGPPLVLYGIADQALVRGRRTAAFELAEVFSYFLGTAEYAAESSDSAVASVLVEDGVLTVTPEATGTAVVTVTATGDDGEIRTRRFTVTVTVPSAPLLLAASEPGREGFVRLINWSGISGEVRIAAIDDGGVRRGPVTLRLGANAAVHFNSGDLEYGNDAKGLPDGIGSGAGDWRLEFDSHLDIEAFAYVRTADGFLTGMHDLAPAEGDVRRVAIFNPADNAGQVSRLRVINPGREAAEVTVRGTDDAGASPGNPVRFARCRRVRRARSRRPTWRREAAAWTARSATGKASGG